jgi:hypothetical protein
MTGSYDIMDIYPTNGGNFNVGTDGYNAFNGIVDLTGSFELDTTILQCTMTFNNLDPNKEYIITTTANRNNVDYTNQRWAKVTMEGAETYTQASSTGVVINNESSVSFCIGYNTVNGYVAKWTGVTSGSDGSFSIKSQWDNTLGSGAQNTKGYAMSAFCLEEVMVEPMYVIYNPYENVNFATVNQYKANLHTHTTQSDGSSPPAVVMKHYANNGSYSILAITDHNTNTWPWSNWLTGYTPDYVTSSSAYYPTLGSGILAISGDEPSSSHHHGSLLNDYAGDGANLDTSFTYIQNHN